MHDLHTCECLDTFNRSPCFAFSQDDPIYQIATFLDPATRHHLKSDDEEKAIDLIADWV